MAESIVIGSNKASIDLSHKFDIWSSAKTFLKHVIEQMDLIYPFKSKSLQNEIYLAFYGNNEYSEALETNAFNFLTNTFKIIADTHELRKSKGEVLLPDQSDNVFNNPEEIFDATKPEIVHEVASAWIDNRETICFKSLYQVLSNTKLLDVITELKINFTTKTDPHLCELVSSALHHVSDSSKTLKHGNPDIGKNISNVADDFALQMGPIFDKLDEEGVKSTRDKAQALNQKQIKTLRGKEWSHTTVHRTLKRWNEIKPTQS